MAVRDETLYLNMSIIIFMQHKLAVSKRSWNSLVSGEFPLATVLFGAQVQLRES